MADLVARMMSKEPTDRPSMTQVAQDLDRMLSGSSSSHQPVVVQVGLPSGDISSVSSTLSAALGQSGNMKALEERPARKPRLWLGALVTAGLVALGVGVRFTVVHLQTAAAVQPTGVVWALNSDPPVTQVLRKQDGKELCRTPCMLNPEHGVGRLSVIFRAPNYADEEIVLDESRPFSSHVKLRPESATVMPSVTPPVTPPAVRTTPQPSDAVVPSAGNPNNEPPVADAADKPVATPRGSDPATRPQPGSRRSPADPPVGKTGKTPLPTLPKRLTRPSDPVLTNDEIQIIQ